MDDYDGGLILDGLFAGYSNPIDDDIVTVCPRMQDNAEVLAAGVKRAEIKRVDDLFNSLIDCARNMDPEVVERVLIRLAEMESKAAV